MISPSELFLGFSRYYNSLCVASYESVTTNTTRITSYLDQLGRMLGYRIYSELKFSTLFKIINKQCPEWMKSKMPDMCWGNFDNEKLNYGLILESQQSSNNEKAIRKDVNKLLCFPARLDVLYCAHRRPERIIDLVKEVAEEYKVKPESELLLIIDHWVNYDTFDEGELKGFLLNSDLEKIAEGEAKVDKFEIDSFNIDSYDKKPSRIRVFKNAKWQQKI